VVTQRATLQLQVGGTDAVHTPFTHEAPSTHAGPVDDDGAHALPTAADATHRPP